MPAVYLAQEIRQAFLDQQAETLRMPQTSQTISGKMNGDDSRAKKSGFRQAES
ncbi:MAG: hypothetical protein ACKN9U_12025 [Pirellulaceae bacterium]|jgi:hypothetical protein